MNIFDIYLAKIKKILVNAKKDNQIILPENLDSINVDIPPKNFNCDISTNVAMVLAKVNKKSPLDIASLLSPIIRNNEPDIEEIMIEKPGFINIKFKINFWNTFVKEIIKADKHFGSKLKNKKENQ